MSSTSAGTGSWRMILPVRLSTKSTSADSPTSTGSGFLAMTSRVRDAGTTDSPHAPTMHIRTRLRVVWVHQHAHLSGPEVRGTQPAGVTTGSHRVQPPGPRSGSEVNEMVAGHVHAPWWRTPLRSMSIMGPSPVVAMNPRPDCMKRPWMRRQPLSGRRATAGERVQRRRRPPATVNQSSPVVLGP